MVSVESIIKVQDQLEEYGKLIKALSKSDIQDFGVIILQGGLVCESMLRVIIEDKGYPIDEKGLVRAQDPRLRGALHHYHLHVSMKISCRKNAGSLFY